MVKLRRWAAHHAPTKMSQEHLDFFHTSPRLGRMRKSGPVLYSRLHLYSVVAALRCQVASPRGFVFYEVQPKIKE